MLQNDVYGTVIEWESEYRVGILKSEHAKNEFNLKVSTFDSDSLLVEWAESPYLTKVTAYQILRKSMNTDYVLIAQQSSQHTSFLDRNLPEGYYGYKIIPIIDTNPDKITKHGISRTSNLFVEYIRGQEILAKEKMRGICGKCYSPPFEEINNVISYEYTRYERNDKIFQDKIAREVLKANDLFQNLYNITINH